MVLLCLELNFFAMKTSGVVRCIVYDQNFMFGLFLGCAVGKK